MDNKNSRRVFLRQLMALSACGVGFISSLNKNIMAGIFNLPKAYALDTPPAYDPIGAIIYDPIVSADEIVIKYLGMSCFLIITSNGTRIITDPCSGLGKEPADIVTVSCGHYSHCTVDSVGGFPYMYKRTEPATILKTPFRGVASSHLAMEEGQKARPGDNYIICFEVEGMKLCHLGALGHKLSDKQVKEIGKVDILMVPVGGESTLPLPDAIEACSQLNPKIILPMHYSSGKSSKIPGATIDEFLNRIDNGGNIQKGFMNHGLGSKAFKLSGLPSRTQVIVL